MLDMTHQTHFRTNGKVAFYVQKTLRSYYHKRSKIALLLIIPLRDSLRLLMGRKNNERWRRSKRMWSLTLNKYNPRKSTLSFSPSFKVWSLHELAYDILMKYLQTNKWNDSYLKSLLLLLVLCINSHIY